MERSGGRAPLGRGPGHEDTAGGDIPHVPETDAGVDIRQVAEQFARDRLMVKLAHDSNGSLDCASDRPVATGCFQINIVQGVSVAVHSSALSNGCFGSDGSFVSKE